MKKYFGSGVETSKPSPFINEIRSKISPEFIPNVILS